MFGECHGHIFMNGVDYKKAVSMYAHGVDREDVKRKLAVYRDRGITFYRDGGDHGSLRVRPQHCSGVRH